MMVWVWLGLLAFFVIVEACTANLLTIWFAAGALVAFISSFFIENPMIQVVIFVVVFPSKSLASASHFSLVRLAIQSSVNTSLTWQHFLIATLATPPHPITNTLLIFFPLSFTFPIYFRLPLPATIPLKSYMPLPWMFHWHPT